MTLKIVNKNYSKLSKYCVVTFNTVIVLVTAHQMHYLPSDVFVTDVRCTCKYPDLYVFNFCSTILQLSITGTSLCPYAMFHEYLEHSVKQQLKISESWCFERYSPNCCEALESLNVTMTKLLDKTKHLFLLSTDAATQLLQFVLLVLVLVVRGFSPRTPVFPSPNSISIRNLRATGLSVVTDC